MSSDAITNILIQKKIDYYTKINLANYHSMVGAVRAVLISCHATKKIIKLSFDAMTRNENILIGKNL